MKIFNTMENGYRFNKLIIYAVFLIMFSFVIYYLSIDGYEQHPYFLCDSELCNNPVATGPSVCQGIYCPPILCEEDWCTQEFVPRGEYGRKKTFVQNHFFGLGILMILVAFILNHIIHNRGLKFSLPSKRKVFPEWIASIIRKAIPEFINEIDYKKVSERVNKESKKMEMDEEE